MNLYLTADKIGIETGGGLVTHHECEALRSLGPCQVLSQDELGQGDSGDVWRHDKAAVKRLIDDDLHPVLVHGYAGTFPESVKLLKDRGARVCWTVAAHDIEASRREHEKLGMGFPLPHLTDPELWRRYSDGYRLADVLVTPGQAPLRVLRGQGFEQRIEVIPHGCTLPDKAAPLPSRFTVGYLGSFGADKGICYLLAAWKRLNYRDADLLLAGRDSVSPCVRQLVEHFGGGSVILCGWQEDVSDFYNRLSLYVQPSATEGFGIEVLEAMAHSRPTICSRGAGAADLAGVSIDACNPGDLAKAIDDMRLVANGRMQVLAREVAAKHTWDTVRQAYCGLWRKMLL